jgi:hypothetical protein
VANSFFQVFYNCRKLKISPNIFYDDTGAITKDTRFLGKTVNFTEFFKLAVAFTGVQGTAPNLWLAAGTLTGTNAFLGHDDASLTNYDDIPENWGGPARSSSSSSSVDSSSSSASE